jgi:hypothetical protein
MMLKMVSVKTTVLSAKIAALLAIRKKALNQRSRQEQEQEIGMKRKEQGLEPLEAPKKHQVAVAMLLPAIPLLLNKWKCVTTRGTGSFTTCGGS